MDIIAVIVTLLLMLVGVIGLFIPVLPGLFLIVLAAVLYGWATDFGLVGAAVLGIMIFLAAFGTFAGVVLPHKRVAETGAPKSTILAGFIVGAIGFFVIPVVGFLVGAALGVLVAEKLRTGDWAIARLSTKKLIMGFGMGKLFELTAAFAMVGLWIGWVISQ